MNVNEIEDAKWLEKANAARDEGFISQEEVDDLMRTFEDEE